MEYKLVVIDVDGTLLNDKKELPVANQKMIEELANKGVNFILASGRPYQSLRPYTKKLEVYLPLIAANGAVIKGSLTGHTYYKSNLSLYKSQKIIEYGLKNDYGISLYYEGEIITSSQKMVEGHIELEGIEPKLKEDLKVSRPPIKIIYHGSKTQIDRAYSFLREEYQNEIYVTRSDEEYLELMDVSVSKGRALEYMMVRMNFNRADVIAIGNNFNDLAMFETAGMAVAVDNSPPEVKEAADFITKSNQEAGVSYALNELILED